MMDIDDTMSRKVKQNLKEFMCLRDVAAHLQLSIRTVERLCHEGKLQYSKVNRSVRISEEDLKKFENSVHRGGTT